MHYCGMANLPRMSVQFTEPLLAWLREEAKRQGVSIQELIRRLLDKARGAL